MYFVSIFVVADSLVLRNTQLLVAAKRDAFTIGTDKNYQHYHNAMCDYFSEAEIAEIAAIIINMNVWTRLKLAQGQIPHLE